MSGTLWMALLLAVLLLILLPQAMRHFGFVRGAIFALFLTAASAGAWQLLALESAENGPPADWATVASVPSETCAKCHEDHYQSWRRSYHRTKTCDATPDYV